MLIDNSGMLYKIIAQGDEEQSQIFENVIWEKLKTEYMDKKEIQIEREKIIKGLELAYEKMVKFKISKNSPIVVSKNGKIVEIAPQDIEPTTTYHYK